MTGSPAPRAARSAPGILVVLLAWLAMRESGSLAVGDVFWHLRTGDLILDDGLPRRDPFSWTAAGEPWQPNAWLGDVVWASVRDVVGSTGVSLLAGAAVLGLALLIYRACRRHGAGPWAAVAGTGAAVVFMSPFIAPRPLILGLILAPVAIEAAKRYRQGSIFALGAVALSIAAWSNFHGSFVTGVGIVGLIAIGWALDERRWRRPLLLAATASVAGLLNPFGLSAYLHTLDVRDESVNIDEWQPLAIDDARGVLLVAFMVAAAWALVRLFARSNGAGIAPDRRWEETLPIAVLAVLTFAVVRTGAFFLIAAAPSVAAGLTNARVPRLRAWARPRVGPLLTGLALAGVILAVQQAPELANAGDPADRFSEEVVAAIPETCILLNEYDLGGFVIDRRWPQVRVSQDGRNDLYGADEVKRQEHLLASSDAAPVEDAGITCVLAGRDRPLAAALAAKPDWETNAESDDLVLLVRSRKR